MGRGCRFGELFPQKFGKDLLPGRQGSRQTQLTQELAGRVEDAA